MFTELFEYKDGKLYRKVQMGNAFPVGSVVGNFDKSCGYFRTKVRGKQLLVHRIIFAMHHGFMPAYVDHIDQNKTNNRIENLRQCSRSQNTVNSAVRVDNPHKYKGVTFHKSSNRFAAQTFINGKRVHIGLFKTPEEAALAYNEKAKELFGEFAVLNKV
jgi:hypothetical protein